MKVTFLGHAAFLIETKNHNIVIDPFITGNPLATVKAEDLHCDVILLTHGHGDHLGDTVTIAKNNNALVIACAELAGWLGQQGVRVHPMHIGGSRLLDFGWVKLTNALHGAGIDTEEGMIYGGNPVGFLFSVDDKTVYHAGDTALFGDMKLIGDRHPIDLALLPIGDNFTMGIDDAVMAVDFVNPKFSVPMHFDTFPLITADPNLFKSKVEGKGKKCIILKYGEEISL